MKILYVSQYYPPEMGAPAARVSELARSWSAWGHEVTVLTAFPQHPAGVKRPGDRGVITRREKDGAVHVVRCYVHAARNAGVLRRAISYVSFMVSAMLIGPWRVGKPDVVIATSPQLLTAVAGWWISVCKRSPFVFEVRDLWPESIVGVGAMRSGSVIRALRKLATFLYRASARVVTVGPGYRRRLLANYPIEPSKVDIVTNGVDLSLFHERQGERDRLRSQWGWEDRFVVLYLGTHGMAHGLHHVLDAAAQSRPRDKIHFLFVGDGAEKPRLEALASEKKLSNVTFLPPQPKEAVPALYSAADVCLVPLRGIELFGDVLPSKLFEIMAMCRPILVSVDGEARRIVEQSRGGWFVPPEDPRSLLCAIERLRINPTLCRSMGSSGRRYVEEHFDRGQLARDYLALLEDVRSRASADWSEVRASPA